MKKVNFIYHGIISEGMKIALNRVETSGNPNLNNAVKKIGKPNQDLDAIAERHKGTITI